MVLSVFNQIVALQQSAVPPGAVRYLPVPQSVAAVYYKYIGYLAGIMFQVSHFHRLVKVSCSFFSTNDISRKTAIKPMKEVVKIVSPQLFPIVGSETATYREAHRQVTQLHNLVIYRLIVIVY